jgi:hypothetical protein
MNQIREPRRIAPCWFRSAVSGRDLGAARWRQLRAPVRRAEPSGPAAVALGRSWPPSSPRSPWWSAWARQPERRLPTRPAAGHSPSSAATAWRQNRAGSLSPASSDSQATGRRPHRAQSSASNAVLPDPAGAQTSTRPRPSPSSSRSASRGRGTKPGGPGTCSLVASSTSRRPPQPPISPPRAAQSPLTCTLTASSDPSCRCRVDPIVVAGLPARSGVQLPHLNATGRPRLMHTTGQECYGGRPEDACPSLRKKPPLPHGLAALLVRHRAKRHFRAQCRRRRFHLSRALSGDALALGAS